MKYSVIRSDNVYQLVEKTTGYIIIQGTKAKVNQLKKHLENGGAFNGQTPYFIAQG